LFTVNRKKLSWGIWCFQKTRLREIGKRKKVDRGYEGGAEVGKPSGSVEKKMG